MRNADAEANLVSPPTPRFRQGSDGVAHFEGHKHRLQRRVLDWHRIVEHNHHAVTGIAFERSAILDDLLANCSVVFAQQRYYVLRVSAFSETSEPAQITEERGYFSAMAFELFLSSRCNDQISHLWRQEAPQTAHAFDFAYLVGNALFELLVQLLYVFGPLPQFI